jgi:hypothetical protein
LVCRRSRTTNLVTGAFLTSESESVLAFKCFWVKHFREVFASRAGTWILDFGTLYVEWMQQNSDIITAGWVVCKELKLLQSCF